MIWGERVHRCAATLQSFMRQRQRRFKHRFRAVLELKF